MEAPPEVANIADCFLRLKTLGKNGKPSESDHDQPLETAFDRRQASSGVDHLPISSFQTSGFATM
jgi:hypothetical protein